MDKLITAVGPFLHNLFVLDATVFAVCLGTALRKAGLGGFSFSFWLRDNAERLKAASVFVLLLAALMEVADVKPLLLLFGFDTEASAVGLGVAVAALAGSIPRRTPQRTEPDRSANS